MWSPWRISLLGALSLASTSWAIPQVHDGSFVPDQVLRMTTEDISIACETRHSVVVNGTAPGPPVYLVEGKPQWIRVYNDIADQNVTMHWHGLAQRAAPFSDGTPLVSQWPIPPGHFFDYEIYPDKAGTFFYHSHVGFQAVSAYGALIIKDRCPSPALPKYDEEITLAIADYFNRTDISIEEGLLADPFKWSGESKALLINGKSGTSFEHGVDSTCAPLLIKVKPDTRYRIRVIGGTALSLVTLGIEQHTNLFVIEADGTNSKPFPVDHLQLGSGQRFSVLLKTKSAAELKALGRTNFWIRYENRERPTNVSGYAQLVYDVPKATYIPAEFPDVSPVVLPKIVYNWLEYSLTPAEPNKVPFPKKADRTVVIQTRQYGKQNSTGAFITKLEWGQNGNIWQPERFQTPYLVDFYLRGAAAVPDYAAAQKNGGWDPKSFAFPAKVGEIVDIIWESNNLPTGGWDIHPFHGHGLHFWDLGSGNGTYNPLTNTARLASLPGPPMIRDTTMLYRYAPSGIKNTTAGWRAWRLQFDEAGAFLLHCHILQHHIMGMATAWVIGDVGDLESVWPRAPYVEGYLEFGGSAYGNETYNPVVNHYFPEAWESLQVCDAEGVYGTKTRRKGRRGLGWFGS